MAWSGFAWPKCSTWGWVTNPATRVRKTHPSGTQSGHAEPGGQNRRSLHSTHDRHHPLDTWWSRSDGLRIMDGDVGSALLFVIRNQRLAGSRP